MYTYLQHSIHKIEYLKFETIQLIISKKYEKISCMYYMHGNVYHNVKYLSVLYDGVRWEEDTSQNFSNMSICILCIVAPEVHDQNVDGGQYANSSFMTEAETLIV